jgi:hypothetical protein
MVGLTYCGSKKIDNDIIADNPKDGTALSKHQ